VHSLFFSLFHSDAKMRIVFEISSTEAQGRCLFFDPLFFLRCLGLFFSPRILIPLFDSEILFPPLPAATSISGLMCFSSLSLIAAAHHHFSFPFSPPMQGARQFLPGRRRRLGIPRSGYPFFLPNSDLELESLPFFFPTAAPEASFQLVCLFLPP